MIREYKINKRNSTVCGYPGRDFDWSLFDWEGKSVYIDRYFNKGQKDKAPVPWVDNGFIREGSQYLHVPYRWSENSTIYRVRPNDTMYVGEVYRGKLIKSQKAIKKDGVWYWILEF